MILIISSEKDVIVNNVPLKISFDVCYLHDVWLMKCSYIIDYESVHHPFR